MPDQRIGNETLHYERAGSGTPLVLMHSLGTSSALWAEQMQHWADRYDVIAMDARGHGRSSNAGGASIADFAGDLLALLKQLDVLPAHFVGTSMGGMICSRLHAMQPDAMRSLTIVGSLATAGEGGAKHAKTLAARICSMPLAEYGRAYAQETLLPATERSKHEALAASIGGMKQDAYLQTMRSIFTEDVSDCMKQMDLPVRVIVGREDRRTPIAMSERIAGLIAGSELVVLDDAAHLANLDNPRAFHAAVDEFLERSADASAIPAQPPRRAAS